MYRLRTKRRNGCSSKSRAKLEIITTLRSDRTPAVSIRLVYVDNSQMHKSNALKTQRNNWVSR